MKQSARLGVNALLQDSVEWYEFFYLIQCRSETFIFKFNLINKYVLNYNNLPNIF